MSRNWNLVEAVERKNLFQVYAQLRDGANPDLHYVGVTPLQMAIESYDVDISAMLLHWKAKPENRTMSKAAGAGYATGETAIQLLDRLIEKSAAEKCEQALSKLKQIRKFMDDPAVLQAHVDGLQAEVIRLEAEDRKARMTVPMRWFMVALLQALTIGLLHFVVMFAPEFAIANLPERFVSDLCIYSPFFIGEPAFAPPRKLPPGYYKYCTVLPDGTAIPTLHAAKPGKKEL